MRHWQTGHSRPGDSQAIPERPLARRDRGHRDESLIRAVMGNQMPGTGVPFLDATLGLRIQNTQFLRILRIAVYTMCEYGWLWEPSSIDQSPVRKGTYT